MSIIDFTDTIIAKSDQLNASDIAGSMTIEITDAKKLQGPDQPVHIFYKGCNDKPWKPCKTMRRVISLTWGAKVDLKGRAITLICDPTVTFGGQEVGGIRITHMSHINKPKVMPVRISRNKVVKYTVLPIVPSKAVTKEVPQMPEPQAEVTVKQATPEQVTELEGLLDLWIDMPEGWVEKTQLSAKVTTWSELPFDRMVKIISFVNNKLAQANGGV
jgi:hypothetical protein